MGLRVREQALGCDGGFRQAILEDAEHHDGHWEYRQHQSFGEVAQKNLNQRRGVVQAENWSSQRVTKVCQTEQYMFFATLLSLS